MSMCLLSKVCTGEINKLQLVYTNIQIKHKVAGNGPKLYNTPLLFPLVKHLFNQGFRGNEKQTGTWREQSTVEVLVKFTH